VSLLVITVQQVVVIWVVWVQVLVLLLVVV
jgi:hypothetical protein